MSANQKCYYCGSSFTPGSSLHGTYFGVKESKFGVVHPVCSKKCENEFKNHKVYIKLKFFRITLLGFEG